MDLSVKEGLKITCI